jgi:hypothetical protein
MSMFDFLKEDNIVIGESIIFTPNALQSDSRIFTFRSFKSPGSCSLMLLNTDGNAELDDLTA